MDTVTTLTLLAFCTGLTQIAKKAGIQGDWLMLVCVAAGVAFTYLSTYQPDLLQSLWGIVLAVAATGNVALVKDVAQKKSTPARA